MSIVLVAIGVVLLLICLAGIALGVYMASDERTREPGILFALCWVSAAAGAAGVIMLDVVTFLVGLLCFIAAGAAFLIFGGGRRGGSTRRRERIIPPEPPPEGSEKTTRENRTAYRRRAAS